MAKASQKKAPVGSSFKTDMGGSPDAAKIGKLHKGGKTVPSFNAERIDGLERRGAGKGSGGVKK